VGARGVGAAHVAALRALPGVDVTAIAGTSPASAAETAARLGVPRAVPDYRDMLGDPDVDVVHVCTPNDSHLAIAGAALEAGHDVVCEKPLAINRVEADELWARSLTSDAVAVLNYSYRYLPLVGQLRSLSLSGALGRVHSIRGSYLQNWMLSGPENWRTDPLRGGRSAVLGDIGTHLLDLAEISTGTTISRASADLSSTTARGERLEQAHLLLEMSNGAAAALAVSQVSVGSTNRLTLELDGDAGTAIWTYDGREELRLVGMGGAAEISVDKHLAHSVTGRYWVSQVAAGAALRQLLEATYTAIRQRIEPWVGDDPAEADMPLPSFSDGRRHVRAIDAACASSPFGGPLPLRENRDDLSRPGALRHQDLTPRVTSSSTHWRDHG
jgi:predicted dehydrogenase